MRFSFLPTGAIVLGSTAPPLPFPRLWLNRADQAHHATIWGRTGSGKSKLLQSVFLQHFRQGHGVGLIEPHHDLSFDCLASLVASGFFRKQGAYDQLVYLDWGNGDYVPFNVLAGRGTPQTVALNALEAMLRVWPELVDAPLFQTLFLSSMIVLIENRLPITFLYRLLSELSFRRRCLARVQNPLVQQSFASFERLGRDQVQAAGSTLRRAFLLSFSPDAQFSLGQPENWLDFRQIMDAGKGLIINLGNINDAETKKLLGALLMVQLEQAALGRSNLLPQDRRPFTLLVDEWSAFAAHEGTIETILSQARKYKLSLYLAAQSLAQVGSKRLSGALENCRISIVFGVGRDSAEIEAKHLGQADAFALKEAALTETQHALYQSTVEQFEAWTQELQHLSPRLAYVKLHDRPARKIRTLAVPESRPDPSELAEVLAEYRRRTQRTESEARMAVATLEDAVIGTLEPARSSYTSLFAGPGGQTQKPN